MALALTKEVANKRETIDKAKVVFCRTRTFFSRYFMPLNHDSMYPFLNGSSTQRRDISAKAKTIKMRSAYKAQLAPAKSTLGLVT